MDFKLGWGEVVRFAAIIILWNVLLWIVLVGDYVGWDGSRGDGGAALLLYVRYLGGARGNEDREREFVCVRADFGWKRAWLEICVYIMKDV